MFVEKILLPSFNPEIPEYFLLSHPYREDKGIT